MFQNILSNSDFPPLQYFNDNWKNLCLLGKKFQKKVSQMANQKLPTTMLLYGSSVNLNT